MILKARENDSAPRRILNNHIVQDCFIIIFMVGIALVSLSLLT